MGEIKHLLPAPSRVNSGLVVYYEVIKHGGGERLRNSN